MKRSISIPTDALWQAGFLLLTPFTAAWLMQFTYGVLPWAMPFPARQRSGESNTWRS